MGRLAPLALVVSLVVAGLGACKPAGSGAPSAEVRWSDGGGAELVVAGSKIAPLPPGELSAGAAPKISADESGKRLALSLRDGQARLVYLLGDGAWLGPRVKEPVDFKSAPDLDAALGALFEHAGERRAALASAVGAERGEEGVVRMLVDGAHVDAPEWEAAFTKLPPARADAVRAGLAKRLEPGQPTSGLRRVVALVPLRDPARAGALAARVRELAAPVREPRASAVMLRALAAIDKAQGAAVGCEVLGKKPTNVADAKGTPEEIDAEGRDALVEAALLAIAAGGGECEHTLAALGEDRCFPFFRCNEAGPLTGLEDSKQDEPLCDDAQLAAAVRRELERSASDVLALESGTRKELFAFAALSAKGKVPEKMRVVHARRRYAIVQPKEPPCDGAPTGSPCHCEEATMRDQVCRHDDASSVHVGLCKFEVDDKQKKITGVVASLAP